MALVLRGMVVFALVFVSSALLGQDRAPKKRVPPIYPELAKKMHIVGSVRLELRVDSEGQVVEAKALQGHTLLREAAISAAKKWTFAKAPASTVEVVQVNFQQ